MKTISFRYGDELIEFKIEGDVFYGDKKVLLLSDDNLIKNQLWDLNGYSIFPFLDNESYSDLVIGVTKIVRNLAGINDAGFKLENYHHYVSDDVHLRVASDLKNCFPALTFPISIDKVINRVSEIIQIPTKITPNHVGDGGAVFCLRIVRPRKPDNNPLHRDVWLDRLRNAVNIYAPIAGSNQKSSLGIVPGSHYWMESDIERTVQGATVDGINYTVPAVTGSRFDLKIVRPSPKPNEFMIFSPYLIHGGGINQNNSVTRVSLEMRFWRKG